MKKNIFLFVFTLLSTLTASAKTLIDGIYYELQTYNNQARVTSSDTKYTGSITIPSTVTYNGVTYSITRIEADAFLRCSDLTSVIIPNSVTSIGRNAFDGCSGLTSVTIPNSVTEMGGSVFSGCSGLTSVTIPNSVTEMGYCAFEGCSGLTSVTIPNSLTTIDYRVFSGCSGLTSVTIPSNVTSIGSMAFRGCSGLTSVAIPNSVTSIGEGAFNGCKVLKSVIIPSNVTSIGKNTFSGCSSLTKVNIPYSVTEIGEYAFSECSGLTSVTIPYSVTSIGSSAFSGCSSLTEVNIPNSVTEIGGYAFSGCTGNLIINCNIPDVSYVSTSGFYNSNFNSVKIGDEVTSIGERAFLGCSNFKSVTIGKNVTTIGSYAFSSCKGLTELILPNSLILIGYEAFSNCSGLISVTIPSSVTSIGSSAFSGCIGLTSVTIPSSVTEIGIRAFSNCSGLKSILVESGNKNYDSRNNCNAIIETASNTLNIGCETTVIPNSVTSIGDYSFYSCSSLTSVTIPSSVTEIGNWAFYNCSGLKSVEFSNSVTSIGREAFSGCSGLTSVTIPNSVTSIGNSAFGSCYFEKENYVNNSTLDANANNYWGAVFVDSREKGFVIKDGILIKYTGKEASITIPNSVTSIGNSAFSFCSLTSVTIPNSVTEIRGNAFSSCSSLAELKIGNSVTTLGNYAFSNCTGLPSVTIPSSVTSIGSMAFYGCSDLKSIVVENGNTTYDSRNNCNAIIETASNTLIAGCKTTVIPNSVTSIGDYAFYNCSGFTSITIPSNVTSIGSMTFGGCSGLTDVYCYAENVPSTGSWAFDNSPISSATLHVPEVSVDAYKAAYPWSQFGNIVAQTHEKCATPILSFVNGKLMFSCATESVKYNYSIESSVEGSDSNVTLPTTCKLSVYATKDGYEPSDLFVKEIDMKYIIGKLGDVNRDGKIGMQDAMFIVNYILNGKFPDEEESGGGDDEDDDSETYLTCPDGNHPHMIDLGLPSGTKWACCNVGASKSEDYGDYFAWGETTPKSTYSWKTYKYGRSDSDLDYIGSDIAGTEYDTATANWGAPWQMPNFDQVKELKDNTSSAWTTENGVKGRRFTGTNGGSIFVPATGYRFNNSLLDAESFGYYWSSSLVENSYQDGAYGLRVGSGDVSWNRPSRYAGHSVRPVCK